MKLEEILNLINWEHAAKIIRNWGPSYFGAREEETVNLEYVVWGMWVSRTCCGHTVWRSSLAAHLLADSDLLSLCSPPLHPLTFQRWLSLFFWNTTPPPPHSFLSHQMWGFSVIFLSKTPYQNACARTQHWSWKRFHCGSQAPCRFHQEGFLGVRGGAKWERSLWWGLSQVNASEIHKKLTVLSEHFSAV